MKLIKVMFAALLMVAFSGSALAAKKVKPPAMLKEAVEAGQLSIHNEFTVTKGLRGLVVQEGREFFLVYETADGYLVQGSIFSPTGENLTEIHLSKLPEKDATEPYAALEDLPAENLVIEGPMSAKRHVYIIVDLNCVYCYMLWKATRPYLEKYDDVQIRWVVVAMLRKDSETKALHVFESDKPLETFTYYKSNFERKIQGKADGSDKAKRIVAANTNLMRTMGYSGTPAVVYPDGEGIAREIKGMPKLPKLADVMGKKAIPNTDPQLKRFE